MDDQEQTLGMSRRSFLVGAAASAALFGVSACGAESGSSAGSGIPSKWDLETDVLVLGAGGAGAMAACAAKEAAASVLVLEKADVAGGDTAISGQVFLGPWIERSENESGATDSIELFMADFKNSHAWSAKGLAGEALPTEFPLIQRQLEASAETLQWMEDAGVAWAGQMGLDEGVYPQPSWNTFAPRSWMPPMDGGGIMTPLRAKMDELGIEILTGTEAYRLIVDDAGRVVGVYAWDNRRDSVAIKARRGVVIATGSFNANRGMVSRYLSLEKAAWPGGCFTVNGDGHRMVEEIGGALADMDLGSHWYPFESATNSPNFSIHMILYGNDSGDLPHILVNTEGKRFSSESLGYSLSSKEIARQPQRRAWCVFDSTVPNVQKYFLVPGQSAFVLEDTLEALAHGMLVDPAEFVAEVERYNGFVAAGEDTDFGKSLRNVAPIATAPYYAVLVEPRHYATYGGIKTDADSKVLDSDAEPIAGLYAAGIATGSYAEQEGLYYLGGISQASVFGRQAGRNAATEAAWE